MTNNPQVTTAEHHLVERLEEARKKLALRNYDRGGLAVDEVIGCLIDYYTFKEIATDKPQTITIRLKTKLNLPLTTYFLVGVCIGLLMAGAAELAWRLL